MARIEKNTSEYVVFAEFIIPGLGIITERMRIEKDKPEFYFPIMGKLNSVAINEGVKFDEIPNVHKLKFVAKSQRHFDKSKMIVITYELEGVE